MKRREDPSRVRFATFALSLFLTLPAYGALGVEDLKLDRLAKPITSLSVEERRIFDEAIGLIRAGNHSLALARLSGLKEANPKNSAVRVASSYVLLQAGNLLGAFEDAEKAESGEANGYLCWFLAKVSLATGQTAACKREVEHLKTVPEYREAAKEIEKELKKKRG